MIPAVVSSSNIKEEARINFPSYADKQILSTQPDWYVSLSEPERYTPGKPPIETVLESSPSWLIDLTEPVFDDALNEPFSRILATNPDWFVYLFEPTQTIGLSYKEQVAATGPIWALNMREQVIDAYDYRNSVKALGAVWYLNMRQHYDAPLYDYVEQVKKTGAIWFLHMPALDQF